MSYETRWDPEMFQCFCLSFLFLHPVTSQTTVNEIMPVIH